MSNSPATPPCSSPATLSAWLDDESSRSEAQAIRRHLESCATCREQALGWAQAARELGAVLPSPPEHDSRARLTIQHDARARLTTCLDDETLVAYSEGELSAAEATRIEGHLRGCERCVAEVYRLIRLRVAMGEPAAGLAMPARAVEGPRPVVSDWGARVRDWIDSVARTFARPWPAGAAIVAAAAVILVVRVVPFGNDSVQFRDVPAAQKVQVTADDVIARARPAADEAIVATLGRGTIARRLEESGEWTRIELPDGRRVWVQSADLSLVEGGR